jgi:hypothetical protein
VEKSASLFLLSAIEVGIASFGSEGLIFQGFISFKMTGSFLTIEPVSKPLKKVGIGNGSTRYPGKE